MFKVCDRSVFQVWNTRKLDHYSIWYLTYLKRCIANEILDLMSCAIESYTLEILIYTNFHGIHGLPADSVERKISVLMQKFRSEAKPDYWSRQNFRVGKSPEIFVSALSTFLSNSGLKHRHSWFFNKAEILARYMYRFFKSETDKKIAQEEEEYFANILLCVWWMLNFSVLVG